MLVAPIRIARQPVLIALFVAFGLPVSGKTDQIDDYIMAQMGQLHIPGVSLAIVRDGRTIKTQGYGFANIELKAPATKVTVYEIGSNTKQFTAAAIMMLVDEVRFVLRTRSQNIFQKRPRPGGV